MEQNFVSFLLRRRYWLALFSIILTLFISYGAKSLHLESDYKIYFTADNPQLLAHEEIQETYTKTDNIALMLRPRDGDVFNARILRVIFEITEQAWQVPYASRVDSISNFQNTVADGDDLLVEDLVLDPDGLNAEKVASVKAAALAERQLVDRLVSFDGTAAMINVSLELPPEVDPNASLEEQSKQRALRDGSHELVVDFVEEIVQRYEAEHPDIEMHLSGVSMINDSFEGLALRDGKTLVPIMYVIILFLLLLFFRSIGSVIATVIVIAFASVAAIGSAGWFGYALNTVSIMTPTIVLTIAVCDAVHLLALYLRGLSLQLTPDEAMRESLRLNLQPIVLTSVTTAVGFLTLNFSISPPFQQLGNITAVGVMWAMVLTFTLLPMLCMLLVRRRKPATRNDALMHGVAAFIIANRTKALIGTLVVAVVAISFLPLNEIDDDPITYFQKGVAYRDSMEFAMEHLQGVNNLDFNIECGATSCVSEPEFLRMLDRFVVFLESQPEVHHVSSYIDVIKRLNRSMNQDKDGFYSIPNSAELSAQYNLMYEMSLPYGLDLNNQLNLDKSATRVGVLTKRVKSAEIIDLSERTDAWLKKNHRENANSGSSIGLMFAHVGENNIRSMLIGGLLAILGVTLTIMLALRSFRYAVISIIPNAIPAFMAFGLWGILVGQVNVAVAMVFSISLGILVDDTVHFITKYRHARNNKGLSSEESIHYAFANVGSALAITTLVLAIGFLVLATSDFNLNAMAGALTALTIVIALVFDFLILPPILMWLDKDSADRA